MIFLYVTLRLTPVGNLRYNIPIKQQSTRINTIDEKVLFYIMKTLVSFFFDSTPLYVDPQT